MTVLPVLNKTNTISDLGNVEGAPPRSTYSVLHMSDPIEGTYPASRFNQTKINQFNGLMKRILSVIQDVDGLVEVDEDRIFELNRFARQRVYPQFHECHTVEFDQFMRDHGYSGPRRVRYEQAWDKYLQEGLDYKSAWIQAFLKDENAPPKSAFEKQPRVVQSRQYHFALRFGMHLNDIEKQIYNKRGWSHKVPKTFVFGKGHNPRQRAKNIIKKFNNFTLCEVLMFDLTAFDSTIKRELLSFCHNIYLHCNDNPEFRWILKQQLKTVGYTSDFRYTVGCGGRCSGDFDTSCGNALIMATIIWMFLVEKDIKGDQYCDGDDTLLFVERGTVDHEEIRLFFRQFGLVLRVEGVAHSIEQIEWCQCKPVNITTATGDKYRMVPKYTKRISHALSSPKMSGGYMRAVADGELVISNGVPVLGAFAQLLDRSSLGYAPGELEASQVYYYKNALKMKGKSNNYGHLEPSDECRLSFARAFGISPEQQLLIEVRLHDQILDPTPGSGEPRTWVEVYTECGG
jgi:hypothetical protein